MIMMAHARSDHSRRLRLLASAAVAALLARRNRRLQDHDIATSRPADVRDGSGAARRRRVRGKQSNAWGERYRANPSDPTAAINYAQALRATGQRAQAVAVLEQASIHNPKNMELLGAYGRALADVGNYEQALDVLDRAHTPDQPDWRILSVQGAVLDQMGRHEEAQRYYATALKIVPDEPSVLSNLGLSYALSKDLARAEATLRRAAARRRRSAGAAEPRAGGRPAGPLRGSRGDRARRPAARRGGRQRRLSAADAGAAERHATGATAAPAKPKLIFALPAAYSTSCRGATPMSGYPTSALKCASNRLAQSRLEACAEGRRSPPSFRDGRFAASSG